MRLSRASILLLQNINCMVETYPLEKCNEALGKLFWGKLWHQLTLASPCDDEEHSEVQSRAYQWNRW